MARRSWSASPAVKPAPTMAICIACSWNSGTPRVLSSTASQLRRGVVDRLLALAAAQVGMHHVALDRPGPDDRHLDDQVVEACAASGAAAWTSARGSRSGRRRPCRRGDHLVDRRVLGRDGRPGRAHGRDAASSRSNARRMQPSMPRPSTSTFRKPSASMSSLSHSMTGRSSIAAGSIGTSSSSRSCGEHEAADVLREVAREADQLARQRRASGAGGGLAG